MPAVRGLYHWFFRLEEYNTPTVADNECTYVVRDPTLRVNQVINWPTKPYNANYIYKIDWSFYAAIDPIVASTWVLTGGLVSWAESFTDTMAQSFVGFGDNRATCNLINTVTLASSAEYTQTVKLIIDNRVCVPRPTYGPGGAELACS
jgi:hypothetical protein